MAITRTEFADTGEEVSELCLGTMMFGGRADEATSIRLMERAHAAGIDFWDTAPMYCGTVTESIVGKALRGRRDEIFLASKVHQGVTRQDIVESCEASLTRLGTDRIDLLQIHWPIAGMQLEVIVEALDSLVQAGKVRYTGCCNFPAWVLALARAEAGSNGRARMVSNQPPYNVCERGIEMEFLPYCAHEKIAVICYRPLMIGMLAGKYDPDAPLPSDSRGQSDERIGKALARFAPGVRALRDFAEAHGTSMGAVALAWLRSHPAVTAPIVGVSREEQLEELIAGAEFSFAEGERDAVSAMFDAEPQEFGMSAFPPWRRRYDVLA